MTARWLTADVFDGLATIPDGSVDLVVTSPPFLALRSYLPADHPDKGREIGAEATPAEFIDTLLRVTAELRRVLAPHGSLCVELGDTYAGSGGAGGDYLDGGMRHGQNGYTGPARRDSVPVPRQWSGGIGWPLPKSKTMIPELYRVALAYGLNPLTGEESPAGRWRARNVVTWCRVNPPVGALGDKWRPATSDVVVACTSDRRYWDDLATRKSPAREGFTTMDRRMRTKRNHDDGYHPERVPIPSLAPLLDWWEIPPGGYSGSHYAVFPPALVEPLVKAMAPPRVCVMCGEPSRRIVENTEPTGGRYVETTKGQGARMPGTGDRGGSEFPLSAVTTLGWTDCGHGDNWRPAHVLDPFAGSGTTLAVATGHGHDATGIDLDERNRELARERIGPMLFEEVQLREETL